MRWIPFLLLAYLATVVQTTLCAVLSVPIGSIIVLRVDVLVAVAAAVALRARASLDAILAGWVLGLMLDLVSPSPTGLNALCFGIAGLLVFRVREAVFGENPFTQVLMGLLFCLTAHVLARLFINLYVREQSLLGAELARALVVALCTAAIMPLVCKLVGRVAPWILVQPAARRRR